MIYKKPHNKFSSLLNLGLTALNNFKKIVYQVVNKKAADNSAAFELTILSVSIVLPV
jgi:hypothetical protein